MRGALQHGGERHRDAGRTGDLGDTGVAIENAPQIKHGRRGLPCMRHELVEGRERIVVEIERTGIYSRSSGPVGRCIVRSCP